MGGSLLDIAWHAAAERTPGGHVRVVIWRGAGAHRFYRRHGLTGIGLHLGAYIRR